MLLLCATASAAAPADTIGAWRLLCPDSGCLLRHKDASLDVAGYGAALEVESVGGAFVPVVTVRGVGSQTGLGRMLSVAVWLRLDKGAWIEMPCNEDLRCLPQATDVAALARGFPSAAQVSLRLDVTLPGGRGLPQPEHAFDLDGTKRAVERLKATGRAAASAPADRGLDWKSMLQKWMKGTGG